MLANRREKLLAAGLGSVLALVALDGLLSRFVFSPLARADEKTRGLERAIGRKELEFATIEKANDRIQRAREQSYFADPSKAMVLYQNLLMNTVQELGLTEAVVSPGTVEKLGESGCRLPFRIEVSGPRQLIGQLLDTLHSRSPIQRVTSVALETDRDHSSTARATIEVEALALRSASSSPVKGPTISDASASGTVLRDALADQGAFGRIEEERSRPTRIVQTAPPRRAQVDPMAHVRLIACVKRGEVCEAWLFDESSSECQILAAGATLPYNGAQQLVRSVTLSGISIETSEGVTTISVGETLAGLNPQQTTQSESVIPAT